MNEAAYSEREIADMSPKEFRAIVRRGEWTTPTLLAARGYTQANMAIVPQEMAFEFLLFCNRNPGPCPVIDVTEPGDPHPRFMAPEADLRTDLPKYRVYENGKLIAEPLDVKDYWRDDLVAFLIGCSASFDWSMRAANVPFRLIGAYSSTIPCIPAGRFHGPMVVSCRLVKGGHAAVRATQICSRLVAVHGPPVHYGDPSIIGVKDLYRPDMFSTGNIAPQERDEIIMFWGCGITPQTVAMEAKPSFMITHCPGHMFVTDKLVEEMSIL
jgi:uncharacterized protein YcsI (UPF0317 family)